MANDDLLTTQYVLSFTSIHGLPMRFVADRHTNSTSSSSDGLILIMLHAITTHKETYLPIIKHLMQSPLRIREAWSIDSQNHGDSVALNDTVLRQYPEWGGSLYDSALTARTLLESDLSDFKGKKVVGIAHSGNANALLLSAVCPGYARPFKFHDVILLEPAMIPREYAAASPKVFGRMGKLALKSKDTWANKQEALEWHRERLPWKSWDKEILDLYLEHGLKACDAGLTRKNTIAQEAVTYNVGEATYEATDVMADLSAHTPVHFVFGSINNFLPRPIQDALVDSARGMRAASVTRLDGLAHMIVQEGPQRVAEAIVHALSHKTEKPRL